VSVYSKNKKSFTMPDEIIQAVKDKRLVVFAGAGISTESMNVFIDSLYDEIKTELNIKEDKYPSFPDIISRYCRKPEGRKKFLQKIKLRFDYVQQFKELYRRASQFHKQLAPIWQIDTIITTNWDDYFEKESGAIPIVTPEDFAFFDFPLRKVFKIHGSINNIGSIVASSEDYEKCYNNLSKGIIGSYLKILLATKVLLFVGYSFQDFDFIKIYDFIGKEMKKLIPHSYLVTLDKKTTKRINKYNISIIQTDACFFIETLKQMLINEKALLNDERLGAIYILSDVIKNIHHQYLPKVVDFTLFPQLIYNNFYQDGFIHALDFLIYRADSGLIYDEHFIHNIIIEYEILRKKKVNEKAYHDIAYIDGYIKGLFAILIDDKGLEKPPFFYLYGHGVIFNKEQFEKLIQISGGFHKSATR
jgi:hypothetical protein